jgi:hypothetical protein
MRISGVLFLAGLGFLGVSCSSSGRGENDSTGQGLDCAVCNGLQFDCAAGANQGTATIIGPEGNGCHGTITISETDQLWIRCGTNQVCVEHEDECFEAHGNASGFSFFIPGKELTVSCTGA